MVAVPTISPGGGRTSAAATDMRIGVLAVQGAFAAHERLLRRLGATPVQVKEPGDLPGLAGLVLPGGESTAMTLLMGSSGLWSALAGFVARGHPVLGTCAGAILLASDIRDGRPDQRTLGVVDVSVRRNGFGRQVASFEVGLALAGGGDPFPGVFIRAPVIERVGDRAEVLATVAAPDGPTPVLCRQGNVVISTFHPELTGDLRVHLLAFGSPVGPAGHGALPAPRPSHRAGYPPGLIPTHERCPP